jgi:hypothetical protein
MVCWSPDPRQLERGAMGTTDIAFFVLAGAAPMGVVVALLTLSIALGNGGGVPGTYLIAGVVLALFAAGYAGPPWEPSGEPSSADIGPYGAS